MTIQKHIYLFFYLLFILLGNSGLAQEAPIIIRGKVLDKQSRKPLPFANVLVSQTTLATVTNTEGIFELKIPTIYQNKTLTISSLAYKKHIQKITTLSFEDNNIIHFELSPITLALPEVAVFSNKLIAKIFSGITFEKYPKLYQQRGFYRETLQQNQKYVGLREAVLRVLHTSERSPDAKRHNIQLDMFRVEKARGSNYEVCYWQRDGEPRYEIMMNSMLRLKKNLLHDGIFRKLAYYEIEMEEIVSEDAQKTYLFSCKPKKKLLNTLAEKHHKGPEMTMKYPVYRYLYNLDLYVDAEDQTIVRIDIDSYAYQDLFQAQTRKLSLLKTKLLGEKGTVLYQKTGEQYMLQYVQYQRSYLDYAWQKTQPKEVTENFEFFAYESDTSKISLAEMNKKYWRAFEFKKGVITFDIPYTVDSRVPIDSLYQGNPSFWNTLSMPYLSNKEQVYQDLSQKIPLEKQLIDNNHKAFLPREKVIEIRQKHSLKAIIDYKKYGYLPKD